MTTITHSELFILTLNLTVYAAAIMIIRYTRIKYVNALLLSIPIVAVALHYLEIDQETYQQGSRLLRFLLGPSVVALGYLIHMNIKQIGRNLLPLVLCITIGAVINSLAINLTMRLFDTPQEIITSLHPRSVTTPIAIELSSQLGGIESLTILAVVISGIFGSILGIPLLDRLGVRSRLARGAALGAASHAIGTARAIELGPYEGAISGLAIGLMGAITTILLPLIYTWLL